MGRATVTVTVISRKDERKLRAAVSADRDPSSGLIPRPADASRTAGWIEGAIDGMREGRSIVFAVRADEADATAGICRLSAFSDRQRSAQISYWISPQFRRRGYATAATRLACRLAFGTLGCRLIFTAVEETNHPSRAVLLKCGFRLSRNPSGRPGMLRGALAVEDSCAGWFEFVGKVRLEGDSAVLIIRSDQMKRLRDARLEAFARTVARDARERHPDSFREPRGAVLEPAVAAAVMRAWGYGFREDRHLRAFGEIAAVCGPTFDLYPPFQDLLTRGELEPGRRLEFLLNIATPEHWLAAAGFEGTLKAAAG